MTAAVTPAVNSVPPTQLVMLIGRGPGAWHPPLFAADKVVPAHRSHGAPRGGPAGSGPYPVRVVNTSDLFRVTEEEALLEHYTELDEGVHLVFAFDTLGDDHRVARAGE